MYIYVTIYLLAPVAVEATKPITYLADPLLCPDFVKVELFYLQFIF